MNNEEKLDEATKAKETTAKQTEYVCVTKNYWNGRLYRVGDVLVYSGDAKDLPEHFVKKD